MNMNTNNKKTETEQCPIPSVRRSAVDWFNRLTLEEQFYKTIEHNGLIVGGITRHPSTLTGREIETIYLADA